MLQSSLPRGFLPPGLSYLGYYGDELHPYTSWHIPLEDPVYHRVPENPWDTTRCSTPCPLDLSLKPPATPSTPRNEENIEVDDDDEDDNKGRMIEEPRTKLQLDEEEKDDQRIIREQRLDRRFDETPLQFDALEQSRQSYEFGKEPQDEKTTDLTASKYPSQPPKIVPGVLGYHQQVLMTPHHLHAPMTPPSTPSPPQCPRRRVREEDFSPPITSPMTQPSPQTPRTEKKKKKHARRLKFDEDTSSPVSGTVILAPDEAVVTGDIDPAFNIVEVTEEARAELAKIENRLGPYQCKLCRQLHENAFQLAQHRCSRIAHVEYRCPECDKRFSCPANLASHRRWHKPRLPSTETAQATAAEIQCTRCDAKFTRQAALRKHLASQHPENNNNLEGGETTTPGKEARAQVEAATTGESQ